MAEVSIGMEEAQKEDMPGSSLHWHHKMPHERPSRPNQTSQESFRLRRDLVLRHLDRSNLI